MEYYCGNCGTEHPTLMEGDPCPHCGFCDLDNTYAGGADKPYNE